MRWPWVFIIRLLFQFIKPLLNELIMVRRVGAPRWIWCVCFRCQLFWGGWTGLWVIRSAQWFDYSQWLVVVIEFLFPMPLLKKIGDHGSYQEENPHVYPWEASWMLVWLVVLTFNTSVERLKGVCSMRNLREGMPSWRAALVAPAGDHGSQHASFST